jgi:hypothetical protein
MAPERAGAASRVTSHGSKEAGAIIYLFIFNQNDVV